MNKLPMKRKPEQPVQEQAAEKNAIEFASYTELSKDLQTGTALVQRSLSNLFRVTKEGRIAQSYAWAKADDFLRSLIKLKTDFALAGCSFHATSEKGTDLDDQLKVSSGNTYRVTSIDAVLSEAEQANLKAQKQTQRFVSRLSRKWDLTPIVRSLMEDLFTCDSMILYWRLDTTPESDKMIEGGEEPDEKHKLLPGVLQIAALNPADCRYDNTAGNDRMFYKLPVSMRNKIESILNHKDRNIRIIGEKLLLEEGIPQEWIDAVRKGQHEVMLQRKHGDRWLVQTKGRLHDGLADPSMQCIFPFLEERKMLKEGEFAAAFMMKHFILHAKMGESITQGPDAGSRQNWATPKETKALHDMLSRTTTTARVVTNHTVAIEYVFPPNEIWDGTKYHTPETAISRWNGVVEVVSTGSGATGSSGHIGVKQLIADILYSRGRVQHIFAEFFDDTSIRDAMEQSPPEDTIIQPRFDENILKDAGQLLKELQFLFQSNILDPESAQRELGRDPELIRRRKIQAMIDNQATGSGRPIHEMAWGGGQDGDKGGRPPNEGTTPDADTGYQVPITK